MNRKDELYKKACAEIAELKRIIEKQKEKIVELEDELIVTRQMGE